MKNSFLLWPVLLIAGCSSNTTPVETTPLTANATLAQNTVARDANGLPTPYIAKQNASDSNASSTQNAPAPNLGGASNGSSTSGKMPQVPPGMAMGSAMALPATPQLDRQIAALQKAGDKKKLAALLANRGTTRMNDASAAPRVKYRAALQDYRAALKADATNVEAKTNAKLIEGIYTSMGRPIPQ